jgi:hypothetical protein
VLDRRTLLTRTYPSSARERRRGSVGSARLVGSSGRQQRRRAGCARPSPAALPSEPRVRQCSPQWQASDLRTATTRRGQRGGGRGELHISDTGWPHRQWAWLARRLASTGERPGRAPRPASTPSGACAASRRSARTGLMSVPCDLRSLRTSSSSAWRRQPTTMAANLMPRQTQPRLCPAVPRRSAHTRRWMMGPLFCLLLAAPPSTTLCTARRTTRAPGRPCDARVYYPALRRSAPSILRRGHTARGSGGP